MYQTYTAAETVYEYSLTESALYETMTDINGVTFESRVIYGQIDSDANTFSATMYDEYGVETHVYLDLNTGNGTYSVIDLANNFE